MEGEKNMIKERQDTKLTALCDLVRPWVTNDPQLLRAMRETLQSWERERDGAPPEMIEYFDSSPWPTLGDTRLVLDHASHLVGQLEPERRAGWAIYILEALDQGADDPSTKQLLHTVQEAISYRLREGSW